MQLIRGATKRKILNGPMEETEKLGQSLKSANTRLTHLGMKIKTLNGQGMVEKQLLRPQLKRSRSRHWEGKCDILFYFIIVDEEVHCL